MSRPWRIQFPVVIGVQEASITWNVGIAAFCLIQTSTAVGDGGFGPEHCGCASNVSHPTAKGIWNGGTLRKKVVAIKPRMSQEQT